MGENRSEGEGNEAFGDKSKEAGGAMGVEGKGLVAATGAKLEKSTAPISCELVSLEGVVGALKGRRASAEVTESLALFGFFLARD